MLHLIVSAAFEHIGEANQIGIDVSVRIFQRIAHTGLRGKIDNHIEFFRCEQCSDARRIGQIELDEAEGRRWREAFEAIFFQRDIVIIIHVVDTDDALPAREQPQGKMMADESGDAGDEDFHLFDGFRGANRKAGWLLDAEYIGNPRLNEQRVGWAGFNKPNINANFAPCNIAAQTWRMQNWATIVGDGEYGEGECWA